jgi:hypothetical protein
MTQHKWHKEIKAWADGAEIEVKNSMDINEWVDCKHPNWSEGFTEERDCIKFRIKPQPKEPQYLYVYQIGLKTCAVSVLAPNEMLEYEYVGKIKLEVDDD